MEIGIGRGVRIGEHLTAEIKRKGDHCLGAIKISNSISNGIEMFSP